MCTKGIHGLVLIDDLTDTLNQHLNQYLIGILINTWLTLGRHLINT